MSDKTEQTIPKESPTQNKLSNWVAEQELKSPPAFIEPMGGPPDFEFVLKNHGSKEKLSHLNATNFNEIR